MAVPFRTPSPRMMWALNQISSNTNGQIPSSSFQHPNYLTNFQRDSSPIPPSSPPPPPTATAPSSSGKISPAVLFIIVILAVIFFISGLLHLLIRFLIKQQQQPSSSPQSNSRYPRDLSDSDTLQRQLQQLFHLHDSGLDQAFIDALPVFLYREIVGAKEPFDCAVCLCEFDEDDKLRLLPVCSHAFHLNCIDTWLLSNSTCPLCRGSLFIPGLTIENPVFDFDDPRDDEGLAGEREEKPTDLEEGAAAVAASTTEKRVFPVRLGKFRSLHNNGNNINNGGETGVVSSITSNANNLRREEGESSSSNLDARRCYSMGSYQYIEGDSILQVALTSGSKDGDGKGSRRRGPITGISAAGPTGGGGDEGLSGKRLCARSKGESFSVSKIWQWSNKKGKFPISSDTASLDGSLPWIGRIKGSGDT